MRKLTIAILCSLTAANASILYSTSGTTTLPVGSGSNFNASTNPDGGSSSQIAMEFSPTYTGSPDALSVEIALATDAGTGPIIFYLLPDAGGVPGPESTPLTTFEFSSISSTPMTLTAPAASSVTIFAGTNYWLEASAPSAPHPLGGIPQTATLEWYFDSTTSQPQGNIYSTQFAEASTGTLSEFVLWAPEPTGLLLGGLVIAFLCAARKNRAMLTR